MDEMKIAILAEDLVKFLEEMHEEVPKKLKDIQGSIGDMIYLTIEFEQITDKLIELDMSNIIEDD